MNNSGYVHDLEMRAIERDTEITKLRAEVEALTSGRDALLRLHREELERLRRQTQDEAIAYKALARSYETLKDKYESCEGCDGSTDAGVFCVPCWNRVNLQIGELRPVVEATIEALAAGAALTASCKAVDWEAEKPDTVKFDAESVVHDAAWAKLEAAVAVYKGRASEKPKGDPVDEDGLCVICRSAPSKFSMRCEKCYAALVAGTEKRVEGPPKCEVCHGEGRPECAGPYGCYCGCHAVAPLPHCASCGEKILGSGVDGQCEVCWSERRR